jgi:membrane protease YdiL (CAAX protease family)
MRGEFILTYYKKCGNNTKKGDVLKMQEGEKYTKKILTWTEIGIYCIIFFALWSVRELIVRPIFLDQLSDIVFQIVETSIKLIIWTLPAVLLIRFYKDDMWISLKEMIVNNPKWFERKTFDVKPKWFEILKEIEKWPLIVFFMFLLLIPVRALLEFGELAIHPNFQLIRMIEIVIFVGITEEVVFRGWLLNAMMKKLKIGTAIILNSILFLFIHFPIWIYFGHDFMAFLSGSIGVFLISIILCIMFIKSKNIFVPIMWHMLWNFLVTLFNGVQ